MRNTEIVKNVKYRRKRWNNKRR